LVSFGLAELDRKVIPYLKKTPGYFIELGANDGVTQSNTFYLEKYKGWRGALIEAIPQKADQCKKNRPASLTFTAACVPFDYDDTHVPVLYSNLMSVAKGLEVPDPERYADEGKPFLGESETIYEFMAPARTLTDILLEANAPRIIDFVSLDVEGNEISVLRGVDFERYKFSHMLIEGLTGPRQLIDFLEPRGYKFVTSLTKQDHLFEST
jgi:FkbM family methyltransferase